MKKRNYQQHGSFEYDGKTFEMMVKAIKSCRGRRFIAFTIEDRKHVALSEPHKDWVVSVLGGFHSIQRLKEFTGR